MIHQAPESMWHRSAASEKVGAKFVRAGGKTVEVAGKVLVAVSALVMAAFGTQADEDHIRLIKNGAPTETYVTGGPWTLEQSGAANGLKSSGYCDKNGNQIGNPGTERMQPSEAIKNARSSLGQCCGILRARLRDCSMRRIKMLDPRNFMKTCSGWSWRHTSFSECYCRKRKRRRRRRSPKK